MATKNDTQSNNARRAPIVTVMGHVDHGKTSILDAIRKTNVQSREYGGITQHIGAYQIEFNSQKITFIDTPGHQAFSQMRLRGGKAADIVVLVVAANDSVMPQTKEAISHAKSFGAKIIVAINKIDLPGANIEKVKQDLARENVLVEDWGGDVVVVNVSAKTGEGLNELLEAIVVVSDFLSLESSPEGELEAPIIESKVDRRCGVLVSCIVRNGSIEVGDEVTASGHIAKIKSIMDSEGRAIKKASMGLPVGLLGFREVPSVGDSIVSKGSDLEELAVNEDRVEIIGKDAKRTIAVVLKADTQGTLEAVKASLAELVSSSVGSSFALKFLHTATGDISESDIMLAESVKGLVMGFNVRISTSVGDLAEIHHVPVKSYKTIYDLVDEAKDFLEGTAVEAEAKIKGRAQILKIFKLPSGDVIAGSKVLAGTFKVNDRVYVYDKDPADVTEDDSPLYVGSIKKIKTEKDEITSVSKDAECGILFKPQFEAIEKGMWIEKK